MKTVAKAFTWRMIAFTITAVVVFVKTGDIAAAAGIGCIDSVIKIGAYVVHEKAWGSK